MYYEVLYGPGMSMARVLLDRGETMLVERGAMVGMSDDMEMSTGIWGNPLRGLQRRMTRSGGFLINQFSGAEHGSEVLVASSVPGDIEPVELREGGMMVRRGSFLGSGPGVRTRGEWAGIPSVLTGDGAFFLKCSGDGVVFISGFGAVHILDLGVGEKVVVERGCVVGYDRSVKHSVGRLGTLFNSFMMRRFLIGKFRGPGRVLVQNRNEGYFGEWLRRGLPELVGELEGRERPDAQDMR